MSRVAHVVYRQAYRDRSQISDQNDDDLGSRVALGAYLERCAADAQLGRLMQVARRTANPFSVHNNVTVDGVLELSVLWRCAPQGDWGNNDLVRWYDQEAPHLSDDDRAKVWALFDARPLYGIYEVPLAD